MPSGFTGNYHWRNCVGRAIKKAKGNGVPFGLKTGDRRNVIKEVDRRARADAVIFARALTAESTKQEKDKDS